MKDIDNTVEILWKIYQELEDEDFCTGGYQDTLASIISEIKDEHEENKQLKEENKRLKEVVEKIQKICDWGLTT